MCLKLIWGTVDRLKVYKEQSKDLFWMAKMACDEARAPSFILRQSLSKWKQAEKEKKKDSERTRQSNKQKVCR